MYNEWIAECVSLGTQQIYLTWKKKKRKIEQATKKNVGRKSRSNKSNEINVAFDFKMEINLRPQNMQTAFFFVPFVSSCRFKDAKCARRQLELNISIRLKSIHILQWRRRRPRLKQQIRVHRKWFVNQQWFDYILWHRIFVETVDEEIVLFGRRQHVLRWWNRHFNGNHKLSLDFFFFMFCGRPHRHRTAQRKRGNVVLTTESNSSCTERLRLRLFCVATFFPSSFMSHSSRARILLSIESNEQKIQRDKPSISRHRLRKI